MHRNWLVIKINKKYFLKVGNRLFQCQIGDEGIEKVVKKGDYTLGKEVDLCEKNFAKRTGAKFAISVGNGTDALLLSLKAFVGLFDLSNK